MHMLSGRLLTSSSNIIVVVVATTNPQRTPTHPSSAYNVVCFNCRREVCYAHGSFGVRHWSGGDRWWARGGLDELSAGGELCTQSASAQFVFLLDWFSFSKFQIVLKLSLFALFTWHNFLGVRVVMNPQPLQLWIDRASSPPKTSTP